MAKILIVDDEPRIRDLIRAHLEHEGFSCEEAGDGGAALSALSNGDVDLVILDIMMPFVDGMTCLKEMRSRKINTPVIMLTARGEEYDKLAGLEGGADDYVVKPFSPRELVARVKAVLARTMPRAEAEGGTHAFGGLVIDQASHSVKVDGQEASLQGVRPAGVFGHQPGHCPQPRAHSAKGVELRLLWRGPHGGHPHQNAPQPSGPLPGRHRHRVGHWLQIRPGRGEVK